MLLRFTLHALLSTYYSFGVTVAFFMPAFAESRLQGLLSRRS